MSYRDLVFIQSFHGFQQEMLEKDDSLIKTLAVFYHIQELEARMEENQENFILSSAKIEKTTTFSFAGLKIILINDALTAYSPVLDLSITIVDKIV